MFVFFIALIPNFLTPLCILSGLFRPCLYGRQEYVFYFFFFIHTCTAAPGFPKYFHRVAAFGRAHLGDDSGPSPPTGFMAAESFKRNGDGRGQRIARAVNL